MDKIKKVNLIFIITIIIMNIFIVNKCYGDSDAKGLAQKLIKDAGGTTSSSTEIDPDDYKPSDLTEDASTIKIANNVIGAFQAIGSIVSVLALVLIGIKYIMGSVEEKAEYKEKMVYYIIGAILVFAISNISAMIYDWANTLNG